MAFKAMKARVKEGLLPKRRNSSIQAPSQDASPQPEASWTIQPGGLSAGTQPLDEECPVPALIEEEQKSQNQSPVTVSPEDAPSGLADEPSEPPTQQSQPIQPPSFLSPESEPSIGSTDPLSELSATPAEQLWDMAYDRLKTFHPAMVTWYEKILSHEIGKGTSSLSLPSIAPCESFKNTIDQTDPRARRGQMSKLMDTWFGQRTEDQDPDMHGDDDGSKDILQVTARMIPEASIAWVSACFAPKVLLSHNVQTDKSYSDFIDVMSKLEWICSLSKLLEGESKDGGSTVAQRQDKMKGKLVDLYAAVLSFEMKFICSNLGQIIPDFDEDMLDPEITAVKIDEAEKSLSYKVEVKAELERLLKKMTPGRDSSVGVSEDGSVESDQDSSVDVSEEGSVESYEDLSVGDSEVESVVSDTQIKRDLHVAGWGSGIQYIEREDNSSMKDLYKWFVSTNECTAFLDWEIPGNNLLWVTGRPGGGKTMVLSEIVRQLSLPAARTSDKWFMSYFFCGHSTPGSSSAAAVLRNLIWTLVDQQPSLVSHLRKIRQSTGRQYFDDPNDFCALSKILYSMLQDDKFVRTYFVIDAMDECLNGKGVSAHEDLTYLISVSISLSPKTKWLVSSRHSADIQSLFEKEVAGSHQVMLDTNSPDKPLSSTLGAYIDYKISVLAKEKEYSESIRTKLSSMMRERPGRNFLWVDIVCTALRQVDNWYAPVVLHKIPDNLQDLCHHMKARLEVLPLQDPKFCKDILTTMAIVLEPLHISELSALMTLGHDEGLVDVDPRAIVEKCSAFLEIRDNAVYFRDWSLKEYVGHYMLGDSLVSQAHFGMTTRSLASLSRLFTKNTASSGELSATTRVGQGNLESIQYASVFWIWHICQIDDNAEVIGAVDRAVDFLKRHFRQWLEVLESGLRVARATTLLFSLERHVKKHLDGTSEPTSIIRNARRLLQFHQSSQDSCPDDFKLLNTILFGPVKSILTDTKIPWLVTTPLTAHCGGQELQVLSGHSDWIRCFKFSPDGSLIVSGSDDYSVRIWDVESGTVQYTLEDVGGWVYCLAISENGIVASGSDDFSIKLWDIVTGRLHMELFGPTGTVNSIDFSPDSNQLVAAIRTSLCIWNLSNEEGQPDILESSDDYVRSVAFSSDGSKLLSAGDDTIIEIWDMSTRRVFLSLSDHTGSINSVAFSPDMKYIASGSDDRTTRIWDADTGRLLETLSYGDSPFSSVAFSPDGSHLAFATDDIVGMWDSKSWKLQKVFRGHTSYVRTVAFSPRGDFFASASNDNTIRFWDEVGDPGPVEGSMRQPRLSGNISAITFTHDGSRIASFSSTGILQIWDGHTGQPLADATQARTFGGVQSLMFSPDGERVVAASTTNTVQIFKAPDGEEEFCYSEHEDWVRFAAYSPNGEYLASASDDGKVRVWRMKNSAAEFSQVLEGHDGYVLCVAFSQDGRYLASGGNDRTLRVWEWVSSSWGNMHTLEGHSGSIVGVAFYPDSCRILSSSNDNTMKIWNVQTWEEQESINKKEAYQKLWFINGSVDYVMTRSGAVLIGSSPSLSQTPSWAPYGVLYDGDGDQYWITFRNQKIIFIPRSCELTSFCVSGRKVALGYESGHALLFSFSTDIDPPLEDIGSE